jgi:hypothetical protein
MSNEKENNLIFESYRSSLEEDRIDHSQYVGPDELEPMARVEPQELGDEMPDDFGEGDDLQEGDFVEIHLSVGGGTGEVVEVSPKGTHAIIELTTDQEDGLEKSDRVAVHMSDLRLVNDEEEPVDVDDLEGDVDDIPYESNSIEERRHSYYDNSIGRRRPHSYRYQRSHDSEALHRARKAQRMGIDLPEWEQQALDAARGKASRHGWTGAKWGAGLGALGGAALGALTGDPANALSRGAIGAGVGALGGGLMGGLAGHSTGTASGAKDYVRTRDKAARTGGKDWKESTTEEGCGCPAPEEHGEHGHGISKGITVRSKDNLLDDEPPKLKIAIIKRKHRAPMPDRLIDKIKQAMGLESTVNEEWDEEFENRQRMIHNSRDEEGWDPDETVEWHGDAVIKAAADFLDNELLHDKVNSLDDIHPDLRDDLAAMVIHDLQRQGHLPKRLDYNDHLSERDEYKEAIEEFLADHFEEMVDHAEDKAVERGDRPPADYGASEFPEGDVERVPPGQGLDHDAR